MKETQIIPGPSPISVVPSVAAKNFATAFDAWWQEEPKAEDFPFGPTRLAFHEIGKHFLPESVTDRLMRLRGAPDRVAGEVAGQRLLGAFLDAALDKQEGRYDYGTYCALQILELPDANCMDLSLDRITALRDEGLFCLLGDLLAFELAAVEGRYAPLPERRPSAERTERRMARAFSALRPSLNRVRDDGPDTFGDSVENARALLVWIDGWISPEARQRIDLSILPVHVVHDEYLFLRILQSFELNYAWLSVLLRRAIIDMGPHPEDALVQLQQANLILREAMRLFPLLSTMQVEAFHDFRRFTEGASAIQSAGYKTVESLCRAPDDERLESTAYHSVPDIREAVQAGQATLDDAFVAACQNKSFATKHRKSVENEMAAFARQLVRWRQAHYEIARRFLGDKGGTGYTEGVPYLAGVRQIPVFNSIRLEEA